MSHAGERTAARRRLLEPAWQPLARLIASGIAKGELAVHFPDGRIFRSCGREAGPSAAIHIHSGRLVARLIAGGGMGLAESYIAGEWSSPDLPAFLEFAMVNEPEGGAALALARLKEGADRLRHARRANTRAGSRRNIAAHYDLGNEFYAAWLDPSMTYSAALFTQPDMSLQAAQTAKYARIAEMLELKAGESVLEIGCGWGGFAEYAAGIGCHVTGLTLSARQAEYARTRLGDAGLAERAEIRLEDYRDAGGHYDKIVSIEMFEAVGEAHWPDYFAVLDRRLKAGGRALIQTITLDHGRFERYRRRADFIQRYVFPGGMLPSREAFEAKARATGFFLADAFFFGHDYAETLMRWEKAFLARWPEIEKLGFDARFRRLWRYYLNYCATGFSSGRVDVGQFVLERG
ncbi:cyclopropane-fatty-acyl-phospholipid synthase family protein [Afifella sp. IM 167]|uniref:SAM-dependent methyltransferase n=1 Tax=Afifella sp. IM 167 TaxID=2033586 RepID=UPI001CCA0ED8|nr:cyclopropane-fatty-acyl-phospholipid synthase family protein [Afifella sp. IM 167]MBZ8131921.1 SAM-dependent methyltransferase [Afifella sp. IM 167]